MKQVITILLSAVLVVAISGVSGCGDEAGGGIYCCSYEVRSTGCGGTDWKEWQTEVYEFNIDDYLEGWTPQRVCDKFSGSDTECGGSCCIEVQYRNTELSGGSCY